MKQSYEYYLKLLDELEVIVERLYDSVATTMTHFELSSDDFFRKCRDITDRDWRYRGKRRVRLHRRRLDGFSLKHRLGGLVPALCLCTIPDKAKLNDSTQQLSAFKREPFEYVRVK